MSSMHIKRMNGKWHASCMGLYPAQDSTPYRAYLRSRLWRLVCLGIIGREVMELSMCALFPKGIDGYGRKITVRGDHGEYNRRYI